MPEYLAPEQDVVLSSRVRLARNYANVPFIPMMNDALAEDVIQRAEDAVRAAGNGAAYEMIRVRDLSDAQRKRLVERHLISYDLLKTPDWAAALISSGQTVSVMINEEDHLRVQGLLPGLQLEKAADLAFTMDDILGKDGAYAFDGEWGYLTSCPTNTGTGMRASTMLHLPVLNMTGQVSNVVQALAKLGLTVRGLYGEGSDAVGCLYQLSNQVTLGRAEEDVIRSLIAATEQLCEHERAVRAQLLESDVPALTDRLMRSVGILRSARIMTGTEFMKRMSDLRLAAALGMIDLPLPRVDEWTKALQDGSLRAELGEAAGGRAVDEERANRMRTTLKDF